MLRRLVSYRILACVRRCKRLLCGDFCIYLDVFFCATILSTVDFLLPLLRGLMDYLRCHIVGVSSLPHGWLIIIATWLAVDVCNLNKYQELV